jgi:hypothetical protein
MQDVYLHYNWDGVKTYEGGRVINDMFSMVTGQLDTLNDVDNVANDQDIVIGQFKDADGKYAYMVTNVVSPYDKATANVQLTFNDYEYVMLVKKGTRELIRLDNHVLSMEIGCGDGYFVVPLK